MGCGSSDPWHLAMKWLSLIAHQIGRREGKTEYALEYSPGLETGGWRRYLPAFKFLQTHGIGLTSPTLQMTSLVFSHSWYLVELGLKLRCISRQSPRKCRAPLLPVIASLSFKVRLAAWEFGWRSQRCWRLVHEGTGASPRENRLPLPFQRHQAHMARPLQLLCECSVHVNSSWSSGGGHGSTFL